MPLSSGAEVLWLRTKVSEVANARIEAKASMGNSLRHLWPSTHRLGSLSTLGRIHHEPARTGQDVLPLPWYSARDWEPTGMQDYLVACDQVSLTLLPWQAGEREEALEQTFV